MEPYLLLMRLLPQDLCIRKGVWFYQPQAVQSNTKPALKNPASHQKNLCQLKNRDCFTDLNVCLWCFQKKRCACVSLQHHPVPAQPWPGDTAHGLSTPPLSQCLSFAGLNVELSQTHKQTSVPRVSQTPAARPHWWSHCSGGALAPGEGTRSPDSLPVWPRAGTGVEFPTIQPFLFLHSRVQQYLTP